MSDAMAETRLAELAAIVGPTHVVADPERLESHLIEPRGLYHGRALAMIRPGSTEEIARLLAYCNEARLPVVPQGGNTGLVGGQIPDESGGAIVLSLQRMNRVREIDPDSNSMVVEAGVTLAAAQQAAEKADRLFPLSLASEGTCTIGGNLSTNAGGVGVIAYGNARDLALGLEVVLANGAVINGLSKLRKDNTGYDLKDLFIGAEGTLGIIAAASLKLFPRPRATATAFVGVPDPAAALKLLALARESVGPGVTSFELLPRIGLDFVLRHAAGARDPLSSPHPWYILIELSSQQSGRLDDALAEILSAAIEKGIAADAAIAATLEQRKAFWRLREEMSDAQRPEGGSIKHDVSVPVGATADFIAEAGAAVLAFMPNARVVAFGHLGDGNIHFNVSQPVGADKAAFLGRWKDVNAVVHAVVARYRGSISAEHGVGQLKRDLLRETKDRAALDAMRLIKAALDPNGVLNPGKVL
ncbi:MAG TPA: FAD-binding oxidoreductase [Roseiarcus sp.]|nr:FAD-binding oxidoreductase [Roseiarcus sp.]